MTARLRTACARSAPVRASSVSSAPTSQRDEEYDDFARLYVHASDGPNALDGSWANGPAFDGRGAITIEETPVAHEARRTLPPGDPRLCGTPPADPATLLLKVKDLL